MITDYKFQDLAKFIEDIKFLLARGGGMKDILQSQFEGLSAPQIILKVIKWFFLWVVIIVMIYVVYQIIFKGYPRFPLDLLRMKFYNKVDVKRAVGGVNGMFYASISDLKDPSMTEAMQFYNKAMGEENEFDKVFLAVTNLVESLYQPVYKAGMVEAALSEYYMFYHRIIKAAGKDGVDKLTYIQYIIDNYLQLGEESYTVSAVNYNITGRETAVEAENIRTTTDSLFKGSGRNVIASLVFDIAGDASKMNAVMANVGKLELSQPYYLTLLENDQKLNCMFNDGRTEQQRKVKGALRARFQTFIKYFEEYANVKRITTNKEFARYFVDPDYKLACGANRTKMIEEFKKRKDKDFYGKKNALKKAERNEKNLTHKIRLTIGIKNEKKKFMQRRTESRKLISELKTQMAVIQREAEDAADAALMAMRPKLSKANPDPEDILQFSSTNDSYPDVNTPAEAIANTSTYYTVFVPGYDIYKEYVNIHRETMFQQHTKDMTDDEIVAFIFMQDLMNMTVNKKDPDANAPVLIQRLIKMHLALDKLARVVKMAVEPPKLDLRPFINGTEDCGTLTLPISTVLQYFAFETEKVTQEAITELLIDKEDFDQAYTRNNFKNVKALNDYTFYMMEVLRALRTKNRRALFTIYAAQYTALAQQYKLITGTVLDRYVISTFLNLPRKMQDNPVTVAKYNLNDDIIKFVRRHPIFTLVYFNLPEGYSYPPDFMYDAIFGQIEPIMNDSFELINKLNDRTAMTANDFTMAWSAFEKKMFSLRTAHIRLHLINLYLSHYRDSIVVTDPVTQLQFSRQGLVDIYEDQNISYKFEDFFKRLFKPFKNEFIDGRIVAAWRKTFLKARFNPNFKDDIKGVSYWREFNAFWIDYMGPKMDGMIKSWWKNFKNFTKPRWSK